MKETSNETSKRLSLTLPSVMLCHCEVGTAPTSQGSIAERPTLEPLGVSLAPPLANMWLPSCAPGITRDGTACQCWISMGEQRGCGWSCNCGCGFVSAGSRLCGKPADL